MNMKKPNLNYGNFQDPVGLVMRMLRSQNKAAYSALLFEFMSIVLTPLDWLLEPLETRLLKQNRRTTMLPILIVGPPRSGTTLVYQTLAYYLPVSFFNNLSSLFPHSPIIASGLFNRFLKAKSDKFQSFYGNTAGLGAPNDGFHIWDRWLGKDRYSTPQHLSSKEQESMIEFFSSWMSVFPQPLLNKNNRNTGCIDLLASVFDHVFFIIVQRDPVYVAQSLLIAREKIQGSQEVGWGLGSNNSQSGSHSLSPLEDVCQQVGKIYQDLAEQKKNLSTESYLDVPYEDFCQQPDLYIQQIYQTIWNKELDSAAIDRIQPFTNSNQVRLPQEEFNQLQILIQERFSSLAI